MSHCQQSRERFGACDCTHGDALRLRRMWKQKPDREKETCTRCGFIRWEKPRKKLGFLTKFSQSKKRSNLEVSCVRWPKWWPLLSSQRRRSEWNRNYRLKELRQQCMGEVKTRKEWARRPEEKWELAGQCSHTASEAATETLSLGRWVTQRSLGNTLSGSRHFGVMQS